MNDKKRRRSLLILIAALWPACRAFAQSDSDKLGPRAGFSLGGRAAYFRPKGADSGDMAGGVQARIHLSSTWAVEGSVDVRRDKFGGTPVDVVPVQLSLMAYVLPADFRLAPFVLAGGGWYYTHVGSQFNHSSSRFGPHAGAGAEFFITKSWTVDGSYRYLWTEDIHSQDAAHPLGRNFSDQGYMLTGALNYWF